MSDLTRRGFIAGLGGLLAAPWLKDVSSVHAPIHFIKLNDALLALNAARSFEDDDTFIHGIRRTGEISFTLNFPEAPRKGETFLASYEGVMP